MEFGGNFHDYYKRVDIRLLAIHKISLQILFFFSQDSIIAIFVNAVNGLLIL